MYIQTRAHAAAIAEFLRDTHETPTLVYNITQAQGRALRTLGERIRIIDSEVMTGTYANGRDGYIIGVQWSFSQQGYFQDLELIDAWGCLSTRWTRCSLSEQTRLGVPSISITR